jgi:hypothetical protein
LTNDRYDEAFEVSQSMEQSAAAPPKGRPNPAPSAKASSIPEERQAKDSKGLQKGADSSRSQTKLINSSHFDEVLELSKSGSDGSVDTDGNSPGRHHHHKPAAQSAAHQPQHQAQQGHQPQQHQHQQQQPPQVQQLSAAQRAAASQLNTQDSPPTKKGSQVGTFVSVVSTNVVLLLRAPHLSTKHSTYIAHSVSCCGGCLFCTGRCPRALKRCR